MKINFIIFFLVCAGLFTYSQADAATESWSGKMVSDGGDNGFQQDVLAKDTSGANAYVSSITMNFNVSQTGSGESPKGYVTTRIGDEVGNCGDAQVRMYDYPIINGPLPVVLTSTPSCKATWADAFAVMYRTYAPSTLTWTITIVTECLPGYVPINNEDCAIPDTTPPPPEGPPPPNPQTLTCAPSQQSYTLPTSGNGPVQATFSLTGPDGFPIDTNYVWYGPGGNPSGDNDPQFTPAYSTSGWKTAYVSRSGYNDGICSVYINEAGGESYPTPSDYAYPTPNIQPSLTGYVWEDLNSDGRIDVSEDENGNGVIDDYCVDLNENGNCDDGEWTNEDQNNNGILDPAEPGLASQPVTMYQSCDRTGLNCATSTTVYTDANGYYAFTGISYGSTAHVRHEVPTGWTPTTNVQYSWADPGIRNNIAANFGLKRVPQGTITVNITNPNFYSGWTIAGSGWTASAPYPSTGPVSYTAPVGSYTITPVNVPDYDFTVTPASTQSLADGSTIVFNITYSSQMGTVNASTNNAGGSWEIRDAGGNLIRNGSGTAVDTFPLSLSGNTYTYTVRPALYWAIQGVRHNNIVYPGVTRSFTMTNGGTVTLVGLYNRPAPASPSSIQSDVAPCEDLRISWQDNTSDETGYRLTYKTDLSEANPGTLIANVGAVAGSGTRGSYLWTNPPQSPVYIVVTAYIQYNPTDPSTIVYSNVIVNNTSFTPNPCVPDLSLSSKSIVQVRDTAGNVYTNFGTRTGKDGDLLTFRITLQNSGTDDLILSSSGIIDNLMPDVSEFAELIQPQVSLSGSSRPICSNATGPWYLCINKDADNSYNESGESATLTANGKTLTISTSGMKCTTNNYNACTSSNDPACTTADRPCNNWTIYFTAEVNLLDSENIKAEVWNQALISYRSRFSGIDATRLLVSPRYLFSTNKPRIPQFREIAP
jgi:hypothetical protein